jgi:hypothetical protein
MHEYNYPYHVPVPPSYMHSS